MTNTCIVGIVVGIVFLDKELLFSKHMFTKVKHDGIFEVVG